jgi:hypothetical protein
VWTGKRVLDDETNPLVSLLRLSGVTRVQNRRLYVRNRIYARVFDKAWIAANMPDAEVRRQRAAFRRGVLRTASVFPGSVRGNGCSRLAGGSVRRRAEKEKERANAQTLSPGACYMRRTWP